MDFGMNFVKAETLVQEITADGKVRDIVQEVHKTAAMKEAEEKEERIRQLPEFKRDRFGGSQDPSLSEQLKDNKEKADEAKRKEYCVHTIDEEEFEHYQKLEEQEKASAQVRRNEDAAAVGEFER